MQMCETFHCRPSEAIAELERLAAGTIDRLLTYQAVRSATAQYEAAKGDLSKLPDLPIFAWLQEREFAAAQAQLEAARG